MEEVWHGAIYTLPFLYVGAWRSIMFPEQGRDIPFSIRNFAYRDSLGRETVTWIRTFNTAERTNAAAAFRRLHDLQPTAWADRGLPGDTPASRRRY